MDGVLAASGLAATETQCYTVRHVRTGRRPNGYDADLGVFATFTMRFSHKRKKQCGRNTAGANARYMPACRNRKEGALEMPARPNVVVFDVLETLLNLDPLAERFEKVGQPATLAGPWFMRFQRDAMALSLAGDAAPFEPVAREALRTESQQTLSEDDIDYILAGFASLPTFDDALPAMRTLSEAGIKVGCLTVGSADNTRAFLDGAGLLQFVDHVVTAQAAGMWKPHPKIYHFAAEQLQTPLDRMALVAVHAWDCHGAKRVGALAGWCARLELEPGDVFLPADVIAQLPDIGSGP